MVGAVAQRGSGVAATPWKEWNAEMVEVIKRTVAPGVTNAELAMFLSLASELELSPLAKEIWCYKAKGRDGEPGRAVIMVGRDGLMKNAMRHPDFGGMLSAVVHEKDQFTFQVDEAGDVTFTHVAHGIGVNQRGPIVGAWACVYPKGRKPVFFIADVEEYAPSEEMLKRNPKSPWRNQRGAMILKCAESNTLRRAYNITGVVVEEEFGRQIAIDQEAELPVVAAGVSAELGERVTAVVDRANALWPGSWPPAKVRLFLAAKGDEEVAGWVQEMETLIEEASSETIVDVEPLDVTADPPPTPDLEDDGVAGDPDWRAELPEDQPL